MRLAAFLTRCGLFEEAHDELEHRAKTRRLSPDGMSLFLSLAVRLGRMRMNRAVSWFRGATPQYPDSAQLQLWRMAYPLPFLPIIERYAHTFKLQKWLVLALIRHESRYRPAATSRATR